MHLHTAFCDVIYVLKLSNKYFDHHVWLGGVETVFECFDGHPFDGKSSGAVEAVVIERKQRGRQGTVAQSQRQRVINAACAQNRPLG